MLCVPPAAAERAGQDVLLITIDTLRADALGTYGSPLPVSPRIDALAAQGVVFERAIAASSGTAASHASIMTSRYLRQHSIGYGNGGTRLENLTTLADILGERGYATAGFVGNMVLQRPIGLDRGFQFFDDELNVPERNRASVYERVAPDTTARALGWLDKQASGPVLLWVHYQDPHGPYTPPPEHLERFRPLPRPGDRKLEVAEGNSGFGGIPEYQALPGLFDPKDYRARYAGEIFYADGYIGKLIDAMDAREGEAIVVLTADHGESFGENSYWFSHFHTTTPENAHVPLIIRAPGIDPARRRELVSHVDLMPTILELTGTPTPPGAAGLALGPILQGDGAALAERFVYCDMGHEMTAYRGDDFIRISNLATAWLPVLDGEVRPDPLWSKQRWLPGRPWTHQQSSGPLDPALRDYVWDVVPMSVIGDVSEETRARLNALGYTLD